MKVIPLRLTHGDDLRLVLKSWMGEQPEQAGLVCADRCPSGLAAAIKSLRCERWRPSEPQLLAGISRTAQNRASRIPASR